MLSKVIQTIKLQIAHNEKEDDINSNIFPISDFLLFKKMKTPNNTNTIIEEK
jgi:hypothetical protein